MKPLQRLGGLDAEFFAQQAPRVQEGGQRVGLTAGAVQRQHEQAVQPLPQRMLGDQPPQFRDQVSMLAERQVQLHPVLEHADPRLGQPVGLRVHERAGQAIADRSAPEPQRGMQRAGGRPEIPAARAARARPSSRSKTSRSRPPGGTVSR